MRSDKPDEQRTVPSDADTTARAPVLAEGPIERLREMGSALGHDVPCRIIELYLKDAPVRLATMRRTLASGDARAMKAAAHSLRGSSANLGAVALAECCHQLERLAGTRVPAEAEARLEELENEFREVEKAMRELLAELA